MKILNIWQIFGLVLSASLIKALPYLGGRIVGGYKADIKDMPFLVSLQTWYHFCGGSLIAKHYVLTAAHCTYNQSPTNPRFNVRLGSEYYVSGGIVVRPTQIFQNGKFNPTTLAYDFSIVKLDHYDDSSLPFTIQYVQLPWNDNLEDGTVLTVSGWGYTQNNFQSREYLRAVTVPKVNEKVCQKAYRGFGDLTITDEMICAGRPEGGKDACQGDSGGPLFRDNVIWGVVSWGNGCAKPNYPGVYSRVTSVLPWITTIISE